MKRFPLLLSLAIFCYTLLRAVYIPFTSDECITYFNYTFASVQDIITCKYPIANNHLLNSLLSKLVANYSTDKLMLRMPNLLALILFLYSGAGISRTFFRDTRMQALAFLIFCLNPMLYEFFALCRGYGLSIGLLTFAIWQLFRYAENKERHAALHLSLSAAVLSAFAMLSNLNIVLLVLFMGFVWRYLHTRTTPYALFRAMIIPFCYFLVLVALCANPIRIMSNAHELYYGGQTGFREDTVYSFLENLTGTAFGATHHQLLCTLLYTLFFLALGCITAFQFNKTSQHRPIALMTGLLLLLNITGICIAFRLLHIPLPIQRSTLYLYPLLAITLIAGLSLLYQRSQAIACISSIVLAGLLCINFVPQMNLSRTTEWWFDEFSEQVTADIIRAEQSKPAKTNYKIKFFCNWLMSYSTAFSIRERYGEQLYFSPWVAYCHDAQLDSFDYVYIMASDDCQPQPMHFKKIKEYGQERKLFLFQNQHTLSQPADTITAP